MKFKRREKRTLVLGGLAALIIFLIWYIYLWDNSLYNHWSDLRNEVMNRESILLKISGLRGRHQRIQHDIAAVTARMAEGGGTESLKGFLEKLIKEQAPAVDVKRMKSRDKTVQDLYRQTLVTVSLGNVTIPELVNILAGMESSAEGMKVRELKIKLGRHSDDHLGVDFTVISVRPLK